MKSCILGLFFLTCVFLANGCRFESASVKETRTGTLLSFWVQEFRLYHELGRSRAESLKTVLIDVKTAVANPPGTNSAVVWNSDMEAMLYDAWNRAITFRYESRPGQGTWVVVASCGADGIAGNGDDLSGEIRVAGVAPK
jgi:hypothetical protein